MSLCNGPAYNFKKTLNTYVLTKMAILKKNIKQNNIYIFKTAHKDILKIISVLCQT